MPGVKLAGFEWGGLYNDFDEAFETSIDLVTMRGLLQKPRMPSEKRFKETVMRERKLIYVLDCNSDTTYQKGQEEGAEESGSDKKTANFFAAAGKVQIDSDAIEKLRHESMI